MENEKSLYPQCATCTTYACNSNVRTGKMNTGDKPESCPLLTKPEVIRQSVEEYGKPENQAMANVSAVQEYQNYEWLPGRKLRTSITRIEEIMDFAKKMKYRKLGLAYCAGLRYEGQLAAQIFLAKGFDLVSVCCKCSSTPKEEVGLKKEQKIRGPESIEMMCSPITQAMILNDEKVHLAIMLGQCVGHDTLFLKYIEVPTTILGVKDRVFGHDPIRALYLSQGPYYARLVVKEEYEAEVYPYKEHGRYDDLSGTKGFGRVDDEE